VNTIKTLKLRIKDRHANALAAMAREVNQAWNYLNELSNRSIRERHKWLSAYDLQKYTAGFSKCEGVKVGSATVQLVCEEYARLLPIINKYINPCLTPAQADGF
jgi:putative transposase